MKGGVCLYDFLFIRMYKLEKNIRYLNFISLVMTSNKNEDRRIRVKRAADTRKSLLQGNQFQGINLPEAHFYFIQGRGILIYAYFSGLFSLSLKPCVVFFFHLTGSGECFFL